MLSLRHCFDWWKSSNGSGAAEVNAHLERFLLQPDHDQRLVNHNMARYHQSNA